jgi:hypothetical protein
VSDSHRTTHTNWWRRVCMVVLLFSNSAGARSVLNQAVGNGLQWSVADSPPGPPTSALTWYCSRRRSDPIRQPGDDR